MPSLSIARAASLVSVPNYQPTALFVGGTSGIGQAIAEALVQVTNGKSHIILCGRNKAAADKVFEKLPKTLDSKYEFEQCDATLMLNVRSTTLSLVERLPKLNYLVLSPGFLSLKGRDETSEGIDRKLALNYYARWKFIHDLIPLLKKAKERGEDARVLTVLSAGTNSKIDENDLDLKKGYGLKAAADSATAMNDFMVEDFAAQYPDIAFIHAHPGFVRTPAFHWSIRLFTPIIYLMTVSPADCAQWMLSGLLDPKFAKGPSFINNHAEDVGPNKHSNPALRKLVWEHTQQRTLGT